MNNGELDRGRAALARLEKSLDAKRKIDVAHFHYLTSLASLSAGEGAQALTHVETANTIARRYGGPQQEALGALIEAQALHAGGRTPEAWLRPDSDYGDIAGGVLGSWDDELSQRQAPPHLWLPAPCRTAA